MGIPSKKVGFHVISCRFHGVSPRNHPSTVAPFTVTALPRRLPVEAAGRGAVRARRLRVGAELGELLRLGAVGACEL